MPIHFGAPELIILLVLVLVLFGAGRVSRLGGELGSGIREFRKGLNGGVDPVIPTSTTTVTPVEPSIVSTTPTTTQDSTLNKPL